MIWGDSMKSVIITGANSEIGFSITKFFLKENYNVIACVHENTDRIQTIKDDRLTIRKLDLTNEAEIISFGIKADIIVNVAAYYYDDDYQNVTKEDFMKTLEVNVVAPFLIFKHLLNDNGIVINISSTDGIDTFNEITITYAASKAALNNLTQSLAYARKDTKVYALALNWVNTEMINSINQDYLKSEMKRIGQEKLIELDEIANTIKDVLDGKYESGSIIRIDGESNGN